MSDKEFYLFTLLYCPIEYGFLGCKNGLCFAMLGFAAVDYALYQLSMDSNDDLPNDSIFFFQVGKPVWIGLHKQFLKVYLVLPTQTNPEKMCFFLFPKIVFFVCIFFPEKV